MKDKIVGLKGEFVPEPGKADPEVVEELERMLEQAKAGNLHCIAGACNTSQGVYWFNVGSAMGFDMMGALVMVQQHIAKLIEEE